MHYGAYTGLAFLSILAYERWRGLALALSMILLGVVIELLQHFSPGRTPDIADVIANSTGVFTGITLGLCVIGALARSGQTENALRRSPSERTCAGSKQVG
jgi:VanZ family protein